MHLTVTGFEFLVFVAEPRPFDAETATQCQSVSSGLMTHASVTPFLSSLAPGQILMEGLNILTLPSPRTKESLDPNAPDPPHVVLEFGRAARANGIAPMVDTSFDLATWTALYPLGSCSLESMTWGDDDDELIRVIIPMGDLPRRFFRLIRPGAHP